MAILSASLFLLPQQMQGSFNGMHSFSVFENQIEQGSTLSWETIGYTAKILPQTHMRDDLNRRHVERGYASRVQFSYIT